MVSKYHWDVVLPASFFGSVALTLVCSLFGWFCYCRRTARSPFAMFKKKGEPRAKPNEYTRGGKVTAPPRPLFPQMFPGQQPGNVRDSFLQPSIGQDTDGESTNMQVSAEGGLPGASDDGAGRATDDGSSTPSAGPSDAYLADRASADVEEEGDFSDEEEEDDGYYYNDTISPTGEPLLEDSP